MSDDEQTCPKCNGSGMQDDYGESTDCTNCGGSGKV